MPGRGAELMLLRCFASASVPAKDTWIMGEMPGSELQRRGKRTSCAGQLLRQYAFSAIWELPVKPYLVRSMVNCTSRSRACL
jgi:hypothetical protein